MDVRGRLKLPAITINLAMAGCVAISCSKDKESVARDELTETVGKQLDAMHASSADSRGSEWRLDFTRLLEISEGSREDKSRLIRAIVLEAIVHAGIDDLAALIDLLASSLPAHEFSAYTNSLVLKMIEMDSARAVKWLFEHDNHPQFAPVYEAFGEGLARYNPEVIIEVARELGHDEFKGREVVSGAMLQTVRGDGGVIGAIELRQKLLPLEFDRQLLDAMIVDGGDRSTVIELMYRGELQPGEERSIRSAMIDWGQQDPSAAKDWVKDRLDHGLEPIVVEGLVRGWSYVDPVACSTWLGTLPPGDFRDRGIEGLITITTQTNPDAALAWAVTVSNQSLRDRLVYQVLDQFERIDPVAASTARELLSNAAARPLER